MNIVDNLYVVTKQIFIIAYMTGYLWLRRNPLSLIFTAISPFSLLFILFIVSSGEYVQFAVAGSLVMALVGYGLALGQDISFYKIEYKMQDVFVASPVSSITYMLGLALSQLLYGLPALLVLLSLAIYFSVSMTFLPLLLLNVFLIWGTMSSIGFFLSSHMLHMRNATQLISFVNVIIAVIPPVFYSIEKLPVELQFISYLVPTTHASLMLQYSMGFSIPEGWSISLGLLVQSVYFVFFILVAKKKALWREN
jgi:ABC-2 type transport system permease protein